jgi:osmotically-inducible protein OsmY
MRHDVKFGKGRDWRPEDSDDEYRSLHLGPERGAEAGEYGLRDGGEFSDAYYGPADRFAQRYAPSDGYTRRQYGPLSSDNPRVGGVAGGVAPSGSPGYAGYGQLRAGARSWADLGVHSVSPEQAGSTQPSRSMRGRGPKGYRRTDERLKELACERLSEDDRVDASDIEIDVGDGEITLRGSVADRMMKWRAEDLVEDATRGALIHNRLRVRRGA